MTAPLLEVEKLEVRYGDLIGVADVSLAVPQGGIVALLGSNGAGKTSTLNAIAGLVPASAGSIRLDGRDIARQPAYAIVRKGLALSPEGWRLFVQQSVENNLLLGATPLADRSKVGEMLERVYALFPRLAARHGPGALMSEPKLLLLDEPSLGLAPAVIETMYETFQRLHKAGLTLLIAEQSVDLALEVASYAYVLQVGRSVLSGTSAELLNNPDVQRIYLGVG